MKGAALDGPAGPAVSWPSASSTGRLSSSGAGDRRRVHQPSLPLPCSPYYALSLRRVVVEMQRPVLCPARDRDGQMGNRSTSFPRMISTPSPPLVLLQLPPSAPDEAPCVFGRLVSSLPVRKREACGGGVGRQRQDLPAADRSHRTDRPVTRHMSVPRVDCALICQMVEGENRNGTTHGRTNQHTTDAWFIRRDFGGHTHWQDSWT
jgi:hypothetical protein